MASPGRYVGIQYLRAAAALMVMYFHIRTNPLALDRSHESSIGAAGVDIFFVISGFIMAATSHGLSPREFLTRRVVRIVPLYWLLTTVWAITLTLKHEPASFAQYAKSLFFIPFYSQKHTGIYPLLFPGWTLNFEMAFYLVFAGLILLSPLKRLAAIGVLFATVAAFGTGFYANPVILEFVVGMALADTMRFWRPTWSGWGAMSVCVGAFALLCAPNPAHRFLSWGAPAAAIVFGAVLIERAGDMPRIPLLERLGDASYSIYLTHAFVLFAVDVAFGELHAKAGAATLPFIVASSALAIGCGMVAHRWLEVPLTAWVKAMVRRAETPREPVAIKRF